MGGAEEEASLLLHVRARLEQSLDRLVQVAKASFGLRSSSPLLRFRRRRRQRFLHAFFHAHLLVSSSTPVPSGVFFHSGSGGESSGDERRKTGDQISPRSLVICDGRPLQRVFSGVSTRDSRSSFLLLRSVATSRSNNLPLHDPSPLKFDSSNLLRSRAMF
ncbi:hypothetical protein MRB53_014181 [Persea americana]|uniref:Uncharacterized protein n=1 Tax=Persea americana TaxID=3435 RepID=A0ACC2KA22_PERAE|nr:hypothetical protein MRB53_014181 [Persea americana]